MPKIKKPTVEEHREAQLDSLLLTARQLVLQEGVHALTFASLSRRTDLARSSLYEYFSNRGQLIVALMKAEAPIWLEHVEEAVRRENEPIAAVGAFVRSQLQLVADGSHDLLFLLMGAAAEPDVHAFAEEQHRRIGRVIADRLKDAGVSSVGFVQGLLAATVEAASRQLREMGDAKARDDLIRTTVAYSQGAVTACAHELK